MKNKIKILSVDDEKMLCHLLAVNLEDEGFEVDEANSGREGAQLFDKKDYDVVISDIRMPDGDGLFLLSHIKSKKIDIPVVVFITAFSDVTISKAYDLGASAYFKKPINFDRLHQTIRECLKDPKDKYSSFQSNEKKIEETIKLTFPSYEKSKEASLFNIGKGGVFVAGLFTKLKISDYVSIEVNFDDGVFSPISGIAICRWIRSTQQDGPVGIGLEFLKLDEPSIDMVLDVVKKYQIKSYIPMR